MNTKLRAALLTGLTGLACASATADVTMEQKITVSGGGMMSMMGSDGTMVTMISDDRSRSDSRIEARSGMMKRLAPNMDSSSIVRLDAQKIISLDQADKTWSEVTFAQAREQMDKAMAQMKDMQGQGALPVAEQDCQWSPVTVVNESSGASERFAGVKAKQHIITASQTCTVPKSGQQCDLSWRMEVWTADRMPGGEEALKFQRGMAQAMGSEELMALGQTQAAGMMAMFKDGWAGVLDEFADIQGYPVKNVMSLSIGGAGCTTGGGQAIAMDDVWANAAGAGMDAGGRTAANEAGSAAAREVAEAMGDSVGGRIAGSALGAAGREMASGMFKSFGRKKKDEQAAPEPAAAASGGMVELFTISTELTSVSDRAIDASQFEVPAGWKQVKAEGF